MLLDSMQCDFQGQEEGKAGKTPVIFPLVGEPALPPHRPAVPIEVTSALMAIGTPSHVSVVHQIPASAQHFPTEGKPAKEDSWIK